MNNKNLPGGTLVRIVDNKSRHGFPVGSLKTISSTFTFYDQGIRYKFCLGNGLRYYLRPVDVEILLMP